MWKLWHEYRKESRLFWMMSSLVFILVSVFLIYKLGFQKMHVDGLPQAVLVVVFFFLFSHFIWEIYRQIKAWKKTQYRLLPISEMKFFVSNILFGWLTSTIFLFGYYLSLVGIVFLLDKQVDMANFQEYWKHLLVASYFFLSISIYLQFVYLLSSLISMKAPVKIQKILKYVLFVVLFGAEVVVSEQLLDSYRKIGCINSYRFKITIGYMPFYLEDLIFDVLLLGIGSVVSIFILKKYIEAERR